MKKIILIMTLTAMLFSCSDDPGKGDGGEIKSLTLKVDKNTIEADGKETVTFTVLTDSGKDITSQPGVRVQNKTTGLYLETPAYSATANGTMTFDARYNGMRTNEVTVSSVNRGKYEKYFRNVALFQVTGTWCVNCPNMTNALKIIEANMPGRTQVISFHESTAQGDDPFSHTATYSLRSIFGIQGFPSVVVDMRSVQNASTTMITEQILKSMLDYPAVCGIKISSSFDSASRKADFDISVACEKEGNYSVACAVVVDGLNAPQQGADENYVHNNVLIGINEVMGGSIGKQTAGSVWNSDAGIFSTTVPEAYNVANVRVVVYVMNETEDGEWYVNNIASCPIDGGSVDYQLNE